MRSEVDFPADHHQYWTIDTLAGEEEGCPEWMRYSGTGALVGIAGAGGLVVDTDGTHHIWFDYELG
ncbi:DUF3224 domain-containing protein [Nocardia sp. NBC_00881]|uniref:DUF3224 domain-containing protein n=1 Tax=Nocardia sp. NBC_00881 TaxID=2975995 RepID=UPI003865DBF9|nr:DUF3224 domain-containing protein [Nocardia sp. NBC_00881]